VKLVYKYKVGKRGRGRELDSGVNRESLASRKREEIILLMLYCLIWFKFVHLYFIFIFNYRLKYTLEYYSVTPLSTILLLLLLDTFIDPSVTCKPFKRITSIKKS